MGMGPTATTPNVPAPPPPVDPVDQMIQARRSALIGMAARRGLGSTFVDNQSPQGTDPALLAFSMGSE